jgi:hypothetical protein
LFFQLSLSGRTALAFVVTSLTAGGLPSLKSHSF